MSVMSSERFRSLDRDGGAEPDPVSTPSSCAISVRNLEKSFGANRVLAGIDLEIPAGQFVAVIGKSGCGKSTLLRILMGLEQASGGEIRFLSGGREDAKPNARLVFQEPRLLPWLSVEANVAVGLGSGSAREARMRDARSALRSVQLAEKAGEWPARLSGGQRQRVALARALVSRPSLLALDEPLGALDALTRISMQSLLSQVWRSLGFTAILVTHDVSEAVHLADRVIVLDEGRISLDLEIPQPHPRRHGDADLAALEGRLLQAILKDRV